jgi:hypothetical protein
MPKHRTAFRAATPFDDWNTRGAFHPLQPEKVIVDTHKSEAIDKTAMTKGYRVLLTDGGELELLTLKDGIEVRSDHEPETSWWKRFRQVFYRSLFQ